MIIKSSLDWNTVRYELVQLAVKLPDHPSTLMKMIWNIDDMNSELSRLEVDARRTRVNHYAAAQLEKINSAIATIEKLAMISILMG